MMLVPDYDSSDDENNELVSQSASKKKPVHATDDINKCSIVHENAVKAQTRKETANLFQEYSLLNRAPQGPENPFKRDNMRDRNVLTGFVESQAFTDSAFDLQRRTFEKYGYATDPSVNAMASQKLIGNVANAEQLDFREADDFFGAKKLVSELKESRQATGDPLVLEGDNAYVGPWAKYKKPQLDSFVDLSDSSTQSDKPTDENADEIAANSSRKQEKSIFHGSALYDYQGRSFIHVPTDVGINFAGNDEIKCFPPRKCIKKCKAHPQGVTVFKFFPISGHLLLSAGQDGKAKIWDCYHDRELLRSYIAHKKFIKGLDFTVQGRQFVTCSFDRTARVWDTETGQVISRYSFEKLPNCVAFNPLNQNEFLIGFSDRRILQFDSRSEGQVQEYDHHLGAINTVTFIANRFISTSDDKSVRVWDYGIPVPTKIIAELHMHSINSVALHPSNKYIACQSLDNKILVLAVDEKIKLFKKKVFKGHVSSNYSVGLGFSPDGRYLCSSDGSGSAVFWDWKTCKLLQSLQAHNGPTVSIAYHPKEPSKVVTGGSRDGLLKFWA